MATARALALVALLAAAAAPRTASAHHHGAGSAAQGAWSMELTDEWGRQLPTFEHGGRTYVLGEKGQRYLLHFRNRTGRRVEVVASVDGRDVVDGGRAAWEKRGYLVEPWGELTIDGYRLSTEAVAAFRFGSVARSYAAARGDARDVGVIGVAVFPERIPPPRPRPYRYPEPRPYEDGWHGDERSEAAPSGAPRAADESLAEGKASAGAPSARRAPAPERPGLGTEFGEAHDSHVQQVSFVRASGRPAAVLSLRYDDRRGLLAAGVELDRYAWGRGDEAWRREQAEPFRGNGPFAEPPSGWRPY